MIRRGGWVAVVVGLAAALAACSVQVVGAPVPVPNPTFPVTTTGKPEPTAVSLLGDLPTVDPCSLIETADVARFGTPVVAPLESLDYCALTLTTAGGTKLDLAVGFLDKVESVGELSAELKPYQGELRIATESGDQSHCPRRLVFSDLVTLAVTVDNYSSGGSTATELCGIADAAMTAVADRVLGDKVKHRKFTGKSIGNVDPCSSVTPASIAQVPGLTTAKVRPYPAGHQCRWSKDGTPAPPRARVIYSIGTPTKADAKNTTMEDVAGRQTAVTKTSATSLVLCAAETAHFSADGGLSELAMVTVSLPAGSQVDAACTAAKAVAADVWAKLPK